MYFSDKIMWCHSFPDTVCYPRGSGQLVPKTTRTQDISYPEQILPKSTPTQDIWYPGYLVPRTIRTQDNSYTGQRVPNTNHT